VKNLVYCSNCGSKIDDEAYFCPACGTKTLKGKAAKAAYPADEFRDAFYNIGIELERAFNIAAHETHEAFKRARDNVQQKTAAPASPNQTVVCPKCDTKNSADSIFCNNCGNKLASTEESQGST
jgi:hypothetical protein